MRKIGIFIFLLVLFISVSAVSAEGNFTALQDEINSSTESMEITQDYAYDNETDSGINTGIVIDKENFIMNGNGFTIDGSNQSRIFVINKGSNITINNLNIINGNFSTKDGGAINCLGTATFNNVTFFNNRGKTGGSIYAEAPITLNNVVFSGNTAIWGACVYSTNETHIFDSIFDDSSAKYAAAIYATNEITIFNSTFNNLYANETAGAVALRELESVEISECTFSNAKAIKNAGALFIDGSMSESVDVYISNSSFINSSADFGGALLELNSELILENCEFINNSAIYDGGGIYISYVNGKIINTLIEGNQLQSDNFSNGGGIYIDYGDLEIENCEFTGNTKQGIYSYDSSIDMHNLSFSNNGEAIHGVFSNLSLKDVDPGNDTLFLNDTNYESDIFEISQPLVLINNTINVETLPSRYDSRDWGWVSSVKDQGDMGSCWTFGTCGALESALLKATGIEYDFSENNMQNSMLQFSKYGIIGSEEGGIREQGLEYILSWFGVMPTEYDSYDELGKISPLITTDENIHIFDAIFIDTRKNATDNDAIKKAILKCGSVLAGYYHSEIYLNNETYAYNQNKYNYTNHAISLVGWDDNYPASNFKITPEGNGAFIIKNSWGSEFGLDGYMYISYYDKSFMNRTFGIGFLIENTENYTINYQTDLGGYIINYNDSVEYFKNNYIAHSPELISAVGTYFSENENYTIEIYVNDELAHTQNGTAPYTGFHTVKLTCEIPITEGDNFTALMKKPNCYILENSRQYYRENSSLIKYSNGTIVDLAKNELTASLKVYTKKLTIYTEDLVKIYKNDSQFEAYVGEANETVVFEINGGNYTRTTDENGTARMAINLNPGNYTIKTTYKNVTVENNIEVLPTLYAKDLVKYFRNETHFLISLIDGAGNPVSGVNITMNINGVFYNRTTNENGTAKMNIWLNPGEYILTAIDPLTGLMMSYNITVLPILNASDLNMTYLDGSQFKASVLDGEGNPLANAAVTFNVNGVFYTRYTGSDGIAKLNIKLMAGKYIITSEYNNARVSNTITIKD